MQYSTPGPVHLVINATNGSVAVEAGKTDLTEITVERPDGGEPVDVTHHEINGEHTITISAPRTRSRARLFGMLVGSTTIRAQVPEGASVTMNGLSADLTVRGVMGRIEAKSASGDIRIEHCAGARLGSLSGDVDVERAEGSCTVQTASGDVRIGRLRGDLRGRTVSGDLVLSSVPEGELSVGTVSGDVRIGVPPGSRLAVDANSTSGDLSSEFDLSETAGGGDGPIVDIRVQTVSGDVRLVRAAQEVAA